MKGNAYWKTGMGEDSREAFAIYDPIDIRIVKALRTKGILDQAS